MLKPLTGRGGFTGRAPGGTSRWTGRERDPVPLAPVIVVEVSADHITGDYMRHGAGSCGSDRTSGRRIVGWTRSGSRFNKNRGDQRCPSGSQSRRLLLFMTHLKSRDHSSPPSTVSAAISARGRPRCRPRENKRDGPSGAPVVCGDLDLRWFGARSGRGARSDGTPAHYKAPSLQAEFIEPYAARHRPRQRVLVRARAEMSGGHAPSPSYIRQTAAPLLGTKAGVWEARRSTAHGRRSEWESGLGRRLERRQPHVSTCRSDAVSSLSSSETHRVPGTSLN